MSLDDVVERHPFLRHDAARFLTDPAFVRAFLSTPPTGALRDDWNAAKRPATQVFLSNHRALRNEWTGYKAQLRVHAAPLWFVDPDEVARLVRGPEAQALLRACPTPEAMGPALSALWYAHATTLAWSEDADARLKAHLERAALDLRQSDGSDCESSNLVLRRTDDWGNNLLGSACQRVRRGGDATPLYDAISWLHRGMDLQVASTYLAHTNNVNESTQAQLRRLPECVRRRAGQRLASPFQRAHAARWKVGYNDANASQYELERALVEAL